MGIFAPGAYADIEMPFDPGDILLLYTDGAMEVEDAKEEAFGRERLKALLELSPDKSAREIIARIRKVLERHLAGADLIDDVTLLAVQCIEPPAPPNQT
ncbi:MAG TPA: SpoIIE family protein phosphatase, partial [Thermoanaerobaculia bacterium]|nr:SpoIIE family protein phosphatase [Thermoanaerobaculia bacterium]